MHRFSPIESVFKGRHFDGQIIIWCVRWYTSFKLSLRDLVIMMAERGISVRHTTILRWVQRYLPEFEKRWRRYARPIGGSWRMDETYIKVRGQWVNQTFSQYAALGAQHLQLMDGNQVDRRRFDSLVESILGSDESFIVDNGASTFIPLWHYMIENAVTPVLRQSNRRFVIHTGITGAP